MTEDHPTPTDRPTGAGTSPAGPWPSLDQAPFEQVTVVVQAGSGRLQRLSRWAEAFSADPELSRCRVVVVQRGAETTDLAQALEPLVGVTVTALTDSADPTPADVLDGYDLLFDSIATPWFCLSGLPRRTTRSTLRL